MGKRGDVWLQKSDFYLSPLGSQEIHCWAYDLSHSFDKYLLSAYWVSGIVPGPSSTGCVKQRWFISLRSWWKKTLGQLLYAQKMPLCIFWCLTPGSLDPVTKGPHWCFQPLVSLELRPWPWSFTEMACRIFVYLSPCWVQGQSFSLNTVVIWTGPRVVPLCRSPISTVPGTWLSWLGVFSNPDSRGEQTDAGRKGREWKMHALVYRRSLTLGQVPPWGIKT